MKTKISLTIISILIFSSLTFSQKLKADGWEVAIEKYEKKEIGMFGDLKMSHVGVISIKRGKTNRKSHRFSFTEKEGKLDQLTISDLSKKSKPPVITYSDTDKSFTYTDSTGKEIKKTAMKSGKTKEIILSGMIVWLNYK